MRGQFLSGFFSILLFLGGFAITAPESVAAADQYHEYDTGPADWKIGDFELLNAIDCWARGECGDFMLLDLIDFWAAGCYRWNGENIKYEPCEKNTASGTYQYDSESKKLTLNFTSSDFIECGPQEGSIMVFTVQSISSTELKWADSDGDLTTWERISGTGNDILGTWLMVDSSSGNTYELTFKNDGSIHLEAVIMSCSNDPEKYSIPIASIVIDGDISDWVGLEPVYIDAESDENPDENFSGTDLHKFYLAMDNEFLYMGMTLFDGGPNSELFIQYVFQTYETPDSENPVNQVAARLNAAQSEYHTNDSLVLLNTIINGIDHYDEYPPDHVGTGTEFIEWKIPVSDLQPVDRKYASVYIQRLELNDSEEPYSSSDGNSHMVQLMEPFFPQNKTVSIDGNYSDWDISDRIYLDDDGPDCDQAGQDIKEVYLAEDTQFIYLRYILSGTPDETFGYKFGNEPMHTYVGQNSGGSYINYANGLELPNPPLSDDFVHIDGSQFEAKFYKSDVRQHWENEELQAWSDQGRETVCRDYIELPRIDFSW